MSREKVPGERRKDEGIWARENIKTTIFKRKKKLRSFWWIWWKSQKGTMAEKQLCWMIIGDLTIQTDINMANIDCLWVETSYNSRLRFKKQSQEIGHISKMPIHRMLCDYLCALWFIYTHSDSIILFCDDQLVNNMKIMQIEMSSWKWKGIFEMLRIYLMESCFIYANSFKRRIIELMMICLIPFFFSTMIVQEWSEYYWKQGCSIVIHFHIRCNIQHLIFFF